VTAVWIPDEAAWRSVTAINLPYQDRAPQLWVSLDGEWGVTLGMLWSPRFGITAGPVTWFELD
jgi:hypothetical protein